MQTQKNRHVPNLKKQGLFPTEVKEQQSGKATSGDGLNIEIDFSKYFERVSSQELAEMTNQMETLIRTSVSIDETLEILRDQTENNMLRLALVEVKDKVTKGLSLSEAMKDHPKIFDKLYVSLVEVGQETGQLDEILGRLREHTGKMVGPPTKGHQSDQLSAPYNADFWWCGSWNLCGSDP